VIKKRDEASETLIALRRAMGMTQAQFAVVVLETAVTTVARYETSHPPQHELLLRLANIARQHGHDDLYGRFNFLYLKGAIQRLKYYKDQLSEEDHHAE